MSNENPTNSREVFDENEAGIAQKKQEITDAVVAGDYGKVAELAQEAKSMETAKAEMMGNAQDDALEMNKGMDEAKAAEEKAGREAALAESAKLDAEKSQQEAAALLEKLKGGNVGDSPVESTNQVKETKQEDLVEQIGTPKTEMFEKYGSTMHEAADELVLIAKEMNKNDEELRKMQTDYAEASGDEAKRAEITKSHDALNNANNAYRERREELSNNASRGSNVIKFRNQKYGSESYDGYFKYKREQTDAYHETAIDDPYIVLRMIEAGQIGFEYEGFRSIKREISERLRSNPEFMEKVLDMMSPVQADGFWANVEGEANNRDLYIKAVEKNHLNYQWGKNEWKSDPEIQKVALNSGLYPDYLYKG